MPIEPLQEPLRLPMREIRQISALEAFELRFARASPGEKRVDIPLGRCLWQRDRHRIALYVHSHLPEPVYELAPRVRRGVRVLIREEHLREKAPRDGLTPLDDQKQDR